jgi:hypothetical protein
MKAKGQSSVIVYRTVLAVLLQNTSVELGVGSPGYEASHMIRKGQAQDLINQKITG